MQNESEQVLNLGNSTEGQGEVQRLSVGSMSGGAVKKTTRRGRPRKVQQAVVVEDGELGLEVGKVEVEEVKQEEGNKGVRGEEALVRDEEVKEEEGMGIYYSTGQEEEVIERGEEFIESREVGDKELVREEKRVERKEHREYRQGQQGRRDYNQVGRDRRNQNQQQRGERQQQQYNSNRQGEGRVGPHGQQKQQVVGNGMQRQGQVQQQGKQVGGREGYLHGQQDGIVLGGLGNWDRLTHGEGRRTLLAHFDLEGEGINFNEYYELSGKELVERLKGLGMVVNGMPGRVGLLKQFMQKCVEWRRPIRVKGVFEKLKFGGLLVYGHDSYGVKELNAYVHETLVREYQLERGHEVECLVYAPREYETAPAVIRIDKVMGEDPELVKGKVPFEELTPYYPTKRIFLETNGGVEWDNLSMRVVDLLTPIGFGQRGLIVAPPRTGKTMLLQSMARAIEVNAPEAHLMVLLINERPEEVTDFRRQVKAEVISSTFDETEQNHVHAAEMVIEKARRMVEYGKHVIILLDSITRLARAYNTVVPSSGKILSGGVEAGALQMPKRFFGSARNIEGGGSLTIIGTALVETGSKMDDVIFEEFKGTGNMELNLDREIANKRVFPAINFEKSGTRKEGLLYHPDELERVYGLRRAMRGNAPDEIMEMLLNRIKRTGTNGEFLMNLMR